MPKCKICREVFKPKYFNQKTCLNPACIVEWSKKVREQQAQKEWKQKKIQLKAEVIRIPQLITEAKKIAQLYARLRDKDKPCISCGTTYTQQWDGGHYMKAEIYSGVKLNEINIHKQCCYCNDRLNGNLIFYRKNLIIKIGIEQVEQLEEEAVRTRKKKWNRDELFGIIEHYKIKIKDIKENNI